MKESKHKDWNAPFPLIGTQSSPRCTDLNGDGILDVVIGAGLNEYLNTDYGVLALNGANGTLLWKVEAPDQIVGSPVFVDLNRDGVEDIIIGGRSHSLMAIDGKSGSILWKYKRQGTGRTPKGLVIFNFFNGTLIGDVTGDAIQDLLISNGGNTKALPYSMQGRCAGSLMVMNSKTGDIVAIDTMPDGLETYYSPVLHRVHDTTFIIYGTGGETFGGHLYKVKLSDLLNNDLKKSVILIQDSNQGFISPATLADITGDQINDIIATSHTGNVYCIDGNTNHIIWSQPIGFEANNMLATGNFTGDSIPDFFGFFAKGQWPFNDGLKQFLLDGKNGKILYEDSIGNFGFSSPLTIQGDDDKNDEILMHINFGRPNTISYAAIKSQLIILDFNPLQKRYLDTAQQFKNISTTPWVGDLDHDGHLNVITTYLNNTYKVEEVNGMFVSKYKTRIKAVAGNKPKSYMEY